ncbi:RNA-binding transcriptional accessory protein [Alkalicoccobacillus porphyridii]|uniref:RNA-binding transcriptional accessory protein n=1 Tax=Alkalicoccobacillus porphyridii TaxID=2597270 RepID=A0A553ZXC2_9BACI|nr:Tex family protein [Alkalicoccobacillus porphyridii]TSB46055.1 RNA-binding transcriptional accessory protein [Alkalicoccobacillus porphyridii]
MEDQKQVMIQQVSKELNIQEKYAKQVIEMMDEGNTVPFIARYRKEMTGGLDEVQLRDLAERWSYVNQLYQRKEEVIRLIDAQEKLTEELRAAIEEADKLQTVEDLYRPYKQKRRTRATVAKEKGLEPLAEWLFSLPKSGDPLEEAHSYITEENELESAEAALEGAQDIIAEWIADDADLRSLIRNRTMKEGSLTAEVKDKEADEKSVFEMYYEYAEPLRTMAPHRVLAVNRGEKEGILRVAVQSPADKLTSELVRRTIRSFGSKAVPYVEEAIADSYKRLIQPSIEREIRNELNEKAEEQAIHIFSENLRNLLLQPPMKDRIVLGVDPAFRSGCKLAVVDGTGKVLDIRVIYPTPPKQQVEQSAKVVKELIKKFGVNIIAIGNGTASRETEQFIADVIKELTDPIYYVIVNEAGASVYSASDQGREEFPELQVEERSAISIARRLQDPLAELVKIDPKSVGVGQYQHDVSQKKLTDSLTFVVETVVNRVGVNVNTASAALLQYVAGLSKTVANNIIKQRDEQGRFQSRTELKKIPRLGAKTYEQCIGFLRIQDGKQPLDATGIHPESYKVAKTILDKVDVSTKEIGTSMAKERIQSIQNQELAADLDIGLPTLKDILDAFIRPMRDPRDEVAKPLLKQDVLKMEDLEPGMQMEGTVRNVVDFGAFVDIGVKQDGLVHISKLTKRFVKNPMDVVSVGDIVTVWVTSVDVQKGRIALTMLEPENQVISS